MRGLQPPAVSTPGLPSFNSKAPDARPVRIPRMRSDWVVATVGTAVAFCLAYWYVANNSLQIGWAQIHLAPAVNYACTGMFGPVRMGPDATSADLAALDQFLRVRQLDFSCSSFPPHVSPTTFFDGIDTANAEQPIYLMLLYALL
jgi:hypothetical protein